MKATAHLTRRERFAAAHHYGMPRFTKEEAERLFGTTSIHGHNYVLEATVRGPIHDETGMVENLKTIKELIRREALAGLDQSFLNESVPLFREEPPTLENISGLIWERLAPHFREAKLQRVRLFEDETLFVDRVEGERDVFLTRVYEFCASHRLHEPGLSTEKNREVFGKCNNPSGHGHNYVVEVTVAGEVDARTGTIGNLGEIDRLVNDRVIEYLDHKNLNADVAEFADLNPTAENIARVIWDRLDSGPGGARLHRVRIYETARNIADYYGPGV
ncbi:MAG: 6-pyruvoyl tetrahydropterin synthase [Candidatus Latescibacterota bacterium]|nr:MAG: 6-pyruvoyl tetrahydropterin synthase [Candidatus Latescibacterota bacterium]